MKVLNLNHNDTNTTWFRRVQIARAYMNTIAIYRSDAVDVARIYELLSMDKDEYITSFRNYKIRQSYKAMELIKDRLFDRLKPGFGDVFSGDTERLCII